jgi:CheY-like chemotaxis protein
LHGGTIAVQSDGPERGSCFRIRMPLMIPEQSAADSMSLEPASAGPMKESSSSLNGQTILLSPPNKNSRRVLIVDDSQDAREMLSAMVHRLGNEVRIACDGLEAVEIARSWVPDIVLMDVGMPRLDGCGAAKLIRRDPAGQRMLLVAITGWGQEDMRQRTTEAGFDKHLVKPVDLTQLQPILSGSLERSLERSRSKSRPEAAITPTPDATLASRLAPTT